jgi:hypothetical protein
VLVLSRGRVVDEIQAGDLSERRIVAAIVGSAGSQNGTPQPVEARADG